ncbi:MAG: serine acetyltransferase [Sterolibacteriaceae bacterium]|uniref:Serine acetyltransferase n=1 Tax=Candidatus Methylophosphatis roskildensis TaxID=2899263 RepID=A0A9D7HSQ3_9PROT|nr:serine acetyltransferase [Candidatus Methylophosphatis roskildensis]MBK7237463.1 serine acetyltransferase [Sterolibacteriaceae bacterium]
MNLYRIARWLYLRRVPFFPWLIRALNSIIFGVVLPPSAQLGKGVLLSYQGLGTAIHRRAVIGDKAVIGTGVTIGGRAGYEDVPVIGEGTMIGSGAKVLGPIRIGCHASIGANAVVLSDIPDYAVAVGIPARVVRTQRPEDVPDYFAFKQ